MAATLAAKDAVCGLRGGSAAGWTLRSVTPRRFYRVAAPTFFAAAQRAFASADGFLRAAGLMGFRAVAFFAGASGSLGADFHAILPTVASLPPIYACGLQDSFCVCRVSPATSMPWGDGHGGGAMTQPILRGRRRLDRFDYVPL